jgi:hypothetical protein
MSSVNPAPPCRRSGSARSHVDKLHPQEAHVRTTFSALAAFILATLALADPPKVLHATPDNADIGVDPALAAITIQFDQDMEPHGYSLCGGGPSFPEITGKITWSDARTIVVPVKLVAGKTYNLSVNCPAAQNFKNPRGESAVVYPISFLTRMPGDQPPLITEDAAKSALETLRKAIDERYSYRDVRHVDWDDVFKRLGPAVEAARTPGEVGRAVARLLAPAGDMHIVVHVGPFTLASHFTNVRFNLDFSRLPKLIAGWNMPNHRIATGTYDGIPYLLIADWMGSAADYAPAIDWLKANASAPAIIVDARANSGGDELIARTIASHLVARTAVYAKNKTRDPDSPGGWTQVFDREIEPAKDATPFAGKIAVLMGKGCMSSNESFLLMLRRGGAHAMLIGETSYGGSGNPRPIDLRCGVTVLLPSWFDMLPDGTPLEGRGVQPDMTVEWKPGDSDPILEAAASRLKSGK